jgi:hypothetical protein
MQVAVKKKKKGRKVKTNKNNGKWKVLTGKMYVNKMIIYMKIIQDDSRRGNIIWRLSHQNMLLNRLPVNTFDRSRPQEVRIPNQF